jgi:hypothetical protein
MAGKREDNQQDLKKYHRAGDREVSSMNFQWVAENQELDLVEWLTPFEMEESSSTTSNASIRGKKKKPLDDGDNLD